MADGDLPMLLGSGFEITRYPRKFEIPEVVSHLVLTEGKQSGQMRLDFRMQKQVLLYEYRYGLKPDDSAEPEWGALFITTSSRNNILAPQEPFKRYYVQVRVVNGVGISPWSDPASYITRLGVCVVKFSLFHCLIV